MSWLEAVVLGILQGVTEFLPISSSGHLVFVQNLFGLKEPPLFFDVMVHVATLFATLVIFRKKIWDLICSLKRLPSFSLSLFQKGHLAIGDDADAWTVILIFVATLVTGMIGLLFKKFFLKAFELLPVVAICWVITGIVLYLTRGKKNEKGKTPASTSLKDAALIGLAQALAILPGISRSGATISIALLLGFRRAYAGEFSFLISIPAILIVLILSLLELTSASVSSKEMALGFLTAFGFGLISLKLLLRWVRSGVLSQFAYYCWIMAMLAGFFSLRT